MRKARITWSLVIPLSFDVGMSVVDLFISKIKNPSQINDKKKIRGGSGR
jgi:5-methylthioribose kinase